jgi:hypothetical protein
MSTNKKQILHLVVRDFGSVVHLFEKCKNSPGVLEISSKYMTVEFEDRVESFVKADNWENLLSKRPDEIKVYIHDGLFRTKNVSVHPI